MMSNVGVSTRNWPEAPEPRDLKFVYVKQYLDKLFSRRS